MATDISSPLDLVSQEKNPALNSLKRTKENSGAAAAGATLGEDLDAFLLLLVTQLKNQDPTQPLDTNQFTQQIVNFSEVEQSIATNKNLEDLIAMTKSGEISGAVGYIGKSVEATGNKGVLEDGLASFTYSLDPGASKVTVTISDSKGNAVFTGAGATKAGKNTVFWDGTHYRTGEKQDDGVYTIKVEAENPNGDTIKATSFTTALVDGVEMEDGTMVLTAGDLKIKLADVLSIKESPFVTIPEDPDETETGDDNTGGDTGTETSNNNTNGTGNTTGTDTTTDDQTT